MPNRIIKESICTSRKINVLSAAEENFFYRLLVNCDDYGCFFGDADVLSGKLYPRRRMDEQAVLAIRDRLAEVGLLTLYAADGETYLFLNSWAEHQRLRSARRKFPEPPAQSGAAPPCAAGCGEILPSRARAESESEVESESESESDTNARAAGGAAAKQKFAEFVSLTDGEWSSLVTEFGQAGAKSCVEILDNYKGASGKRYQSDYRAIRNWVVRRYREDAAKKPAHASSSYDLGEFEMRGFEVPKL